MRKNVCSSIMMMQVKVCFLWTLYISLLLKFLTNGPGNNFAHMPEACQLTLKGK